MFRRPLWATRIKTTSAFGARAELSEPGLDHNSVDCWHRQQCRRSRETSVLPASARSLATSATTIICRSFDRGLRASFFAVGAEMFRSWRFQLREAEQALRDERLDEAVRVLSGEDIGRSLPGRRLAATAAGRLAHRAAQKLSGGESDDAWRDLHAAIRLVGETAEVLAARREMVDLVLRQVVRDLEAGEPARGLVRLERLERYGVNTDTLRVMKEITRRLESARNLALRGKFADALAQIDAAGKLDPELAVIETYRQRQLAATQVGESAVDGRTGTEQSLPENTDSSRFLLWVDGVGGYLVCLGEEITLGQAAPGNRIDVPILADLSRVHAKIRREDGYVIEPQQSVRVDGQPLAGPMLLSDGDEIELGDGVRLRFRQPHALSATARLEFVSRHRTQPSADGILLMAESCVLGPKWANHVVCRDWSDDVVLYRREGKLFCRSTEPFEVDGHYCEMQAPVESCSHIAGSDFSLCLEPVA